MRARQLAFGRAALAVAAAAGASTLTTPADAVAATGFGALSGPGGCLVAPVGGSAAAHCGEGKALVGANAVAISPDGNNVYVASGRTEPTVAASFGSLAILKRDPASGSISELGCLSSDGTDGRDGASGACTATPSLLGADGVTVSPDGRTVFVASNMSASVVAFTRDPATGMLTRLGCFQYHPYPGSGCTPANVFPGSGALATSADGRALYIASPTLGSVSTLTGSLVTPPASGATSTTGATGASGSAGVSSAEASVASIFGVQEPAFVANPCIAVNGYDGSCRVGVATGGLDALTLGPAGEEVYALSPASKAVDVFAHSATGTLSESSCLMVSPPPGLCTVTKLLQSPSALAIAPDGKNVYVGDSSEGRGRIDVLNRNPTTGTLSDSGCVEERLAPKEHQAGEEEESEEAHEAPPPPDGCTDVPGLKAVQSIAVTGDGSMVYAIASDSAVVFSRDPSSGALSEVSCAAAEVSSCSGFADLGSLAGTAASADGRNVYVAGGSTNAVFAFGVGLTVATANASASRAGIARVRVRCPHAVRRACAGRLELSRALRARARHGKHRLNLRRLAAGGSGRFTLRPGTQAIIALRLSPGSRGLLLQRHRLRLVATVRAQPRSGGGGYGRVVRLRLAR